MSRNPSPLLSVSRAALKTTSPALFTSICQPLMVAEVTNRPPPGISSPGRATAMVTPRRRARRRERGGTTEHMRKVNGIDLAPLLKLEQERNPTLPIHVL